MCFWLTKNYFFFENFPNRLCFVIMIQGKTLKSWHKIFIVLYLFCLP